MIDSFKNCNDKNYNEAAGLPLTAYPLPLKKLHIKTYGCQMNSYDSNRMADVMAPLGYKVQDDIEGADMVILNTCHIREKATEKLYSELGRIKVHKDAKRKVGSNMIIAVAGCVGQAEGKEIIARAPQVDIVIGPQSYHLLPGMVTKVLRESGNAVNIDFPNVSKFDSLPESSFGQGVSAFLSVQEGCDKFCTFCVVPYTRGAEYSRPVADIIREANQLVEKGAIEVNLLGQNVNAYSGEGQGGAAWNFGMLIRELAKIPALKRIRYVTSHPRDMHEELYQVHADEEKLMPYLHLPIQAGSDAVLKRMNRRHTRADYMSIIERLRLIRPDIAFSGDFIVGFPGETEKDFDDTLKVVSEVKYAQAYSFKYSPRPGTPAAVMEEQVPEEVKAERLERLQNLLVKHQVEFNSSMIGKNLPVLFDRKGKLPGQLIGKTPYMQSVYINAPHEKLGMLEDVKITSSFQNSLSGEVINQNFAQAA